jgi:hypothetical protein
MNKIVKKHYPIERLPDDLRSGLRQPGWVHVEIELETGTTSQKKIAPLVASGEKVHGDPDTVLFDIRALREDR